MKITPLGKKVLIRPDSATQVSEGGIILTKAQDPDTGVVVSVSKDDEMQVKEGDRVKFMLGMGLKVEEMLLIDEQAILFVYE